MKLVDDILKGGDLRSIGKSNYVVSLIKDQEGFDELFKQLFHANRIVVMRAADAIEKITINSPDYLIKHKSKILKLLGTAKNIELKWHLALLVSRVCLVPKEARKVWQVLTTWAKNKEESKIVRVNSIQALFNLSNKNTALKNDLDATVTEIERENIPSINARIKKLKNVHG